MVRLTTFYTRYLGETKSFFVASLVTFQVASASAQSQELQGTQTWTYACGQIECATTKEMHDHMAVNIHMSCTKLADQSKAKASCNLVPGNKKDMYCDTPTFEGSYWNCHCGNTSGNWPKVDYSIKCPPFKQ